MSEKKLGNSGGQEQRFRDDVTTNGELEENDRVPDCGVHREVGGKNQRNSR